MKFTKAYIRQRIKECTDEEFELAFRVCENARMSSKNPDEHDFSDVKFIMEFLIDYQRDPSVGQCFAKAVNIVQMLPE